MSNNKVKDALVELGFAFLGFAATAFVVFVTGVGETLSTGVLPELNVWKSLVAAFWSGLIAAVGKTVLWWATTRLTYSKP